MATINVLHILAVTCSFISLLILLISLGSDYWYTIALIHQGIWKVCNGNNCALLDSSSAALNAVRAFMLLAMLASITACSCLCARFFLKQVGPISMAMIAAIANFVAALCTMIAMAVFTGQFGSSSSFGWTLGLGWSCFPLFLICGGIAYTLQMDKSE